MQSLVSGGVESHANSNNGTFIGYLYSGILMSPQNASTAYNYFNSYFNIGFYPNAPVPAGVQPAFAGWIAVVNLKNGQVMAKESIGNYLSAAQINNYITQANQ